MASAENKTLTLTLPEAVLERIRLQAERDHQPAEVVAAMALEGVFQQPSRKQEALSELLALLAETERLSWAHQVPLALSWTRDEMHER